MQTKTTKQTSKKALHNDLKKKEKKMVPIWSQGLEHDVVDDKFLWAKKKHIQMSALSSNELLTRILNQPDSAFDSVMSVQCQATQISAAVQSNVVSQLDVLKKLRKLHFLTVFELLNADGCAALTQTLRNDVPNLRQLRFGVMDTPVDVAPLFEAIRSLPLEALYVHCRGGAHVVPYANHLCSSLLSLRFLQSLEIFTDSLGFVGVLAKQLPPSCGQMLRAFSYRGASIDTDDCQLLLQKMPNLRNLMLQVRSLDAATQFFEADFRFVTALHLYFPQLDKAVVQKLVVALRANTHLQLLGFSTQPATDLTTPPCCDIWNDGWLTQTELGFQQNDILASVLKRNRARHESCRKTCLAMLTLRKSKKALVIFPYGIVVFMARYLWEMRNQQEWDSKQTV